MNECQTNIYMVQGEISAHDENFTQTIAFGEQLVQDGHPASVERMVETVAKEPKQEKAPKDGSEEEGSSSSSSEDEDESKNEKV